MMQAMLLLALALGCKGESEDTAPPPPPGNLVLGASALDFGTVTLGDAPVTQSLSLSNDGDGDLQVYDVQIVDDALRVHLSVTGTVAAELVPDGSLVVGVTLDPANVAGPLEGQLLVLTDDPESPAQQVALTAQVDGTPDISVDNESLAFGTVKLGSNSVLDLHIANSGNDDLKVEQVLLGAGTVFTVEVDPTGLSLAPGREDGLVSIGFAPTTKGSVSDTLVIRTNDPDQPELAVVLTGTGG